MEFKEYRSQSRRLRIRRLRIRRLEAKIRFGVKIKRSYITKPGLKLVDRYMKNYIVFLMAFNLSRNKYLHFGFENKS